MRKVILLQSFPSEGWKILRAKGYNPLDPGLKGLQYNFSKGFELKPCPSDEELLPWMADATAPGVPPATVQFDDETLGGFVKYATILVPVRYLTGQLKGLIIRDPKNPIAPA